METYHSPFRLDDNKLKIKHIASPVKSFFPDVSFPRDTGTIREHNGNFIPDTLPYQTAKGKEGGFLNWLDCKALLHKLVKSELISQGKHNGRQKRNHEARSFELHPVHYR
jgi:hypothetical protein